MIMILCNAPNPAGVFEGCIHLTLSIPKWHNQQAVSILVGTWPIKRIRPLRMRVHTQSPISARLAVIHVSPINQSHHILALS